MQPSSHQVSLSVEIWHFFRVFQLMQNLSCYNSTERLTWRQICLKCKNIILLIQSDKPHNTLTLRLHLVNLLVQDITPFIRLIGCTRYVHRRLTKQK